ncbi:MAG: carboxypeptidase-like regulatory domain-containing protein [Nitrospirota bacterium]
MRIFFFLLFLIGWAVEGFATHEADHRYTVSGFVRDTKGDVRPGVSVSLQHKGGQKHLVKTTSAGYYEVMFHLHNENVGEEVLVTVDKEVKKVVLAFDPEDKFSSRRGDVDFGAPGKESPIPYGWAAGGVLLAASAVFFLIKKNKKPIEKEKKEKHKKK